MARAHKSRPADRDIDEISGFIARDSIDAALRWIADVDDFFNRIAAAPGMGTAHDAVSKGLRSVPFGNYLVFFRKARGGVEIVRVIHGARKWQRLLKDLD
jgi:toxin ParE1/3/4